MYQERNYQKKPSFSSSSDNEIQQHEEEKPIDLKQISMFAKQAFLDADADHSGLIDSHELFLVVQKICREFAIDETSEKEIEELMKNYDEDNDGELCYEEFYKFITDIFDTDNQSGAPKNSAMINRLKSRRLSKSDIEKKQLDMMVRMSTLLNSNFDKMMQEIKDDVSGKKQAQSARRMTAWQLSEEKNYLRRRQTQDEYLLRRNTDAQYMGPFHTVKRTGSIVTVYTEMGPGGGK